MLNAPKTMLSAMKSGQNMVNMSRFMTKKLRIKSTTLPMGKMDGWASCALN